MTYLPELEAKLSESGFSIPQLESDPAVIYALEPDFRISYCNQAWDRFAAENGGRNLDRDAVRGVSVLDVTPEPLRTFYLNAYSSAQIQRQPWEHEFECSSPEMYRAFRMRVFPLRLSSLLVENSLLVERLHGADREAAEANAAQYVSENGILTMCCHCRRTRRIASEKPFETWDWVPDFLVNPPGAVSHGLCRMCYAYFYPRTKLSSES
jgi:hypothetical protein